MSAKIAMTVRDTVRVEGVMLAVDAALVVGIELLSKHFEAEQLQGFHNFRNEIAVLMTALRVGAC